MSFLNRLKNIFSKSNEIIISSKQDMQIYLKSVLMDEGIAKFITDIMEHTGKEGFIQSGAPRPKGRGSLPSLEAHPNSSPVLRLGISKQGIKQGGTGNPFFVEYQNLTKLDDFSHADTMSRIKRLREDLTLASSETEKEMLRQKMAIEAGGFAVVWINVDSKDEFMAKARLFTVADDALRKIGYELHYKIVD